jgi:hypothetical protein
MIIGRKTFVSTGISYIDSITCPILGCGFKINLHENEDINETIRILVDKYSLQYLDLKTDPKNKKKIK